MPPIVILFSSDGPSVPAKPTSREEVNVGVRMNFEIGSRERPSI